MHLKELLQDLSQKSSDDVMSLAHTLAQGQYLPSQEEAICLAEELAKLPHLVVRRFFTIIERSCFVEEKKISNYSRELSKHLIQMIPGPILKKMVCVALGEAALSHDPMLEPQSLDAMPLPETPHTNG